MGTLQVALVVDDQGKISPLRQRSFDGAKVSQADLTGKPPMGRTDYFATERWVCHHLIRAPCACYTIHNWCSFLVCFVLV
jgi:hypothetical protein